MEKNGKLLMIKKEYRCPIDNTVSKEMTVIYKGKDGLRNKHFPNEVLYCPICNLPYRWNKLIEVITFLQ